jgi:hypothetical protein
MPRVFTTALAAVLLCAASARADIITIEPDSYAAGADLSHVGAGATLSVIRGTADNTLASSPVYARHNPVCETNPFSCDAVTGTQGFGTDSADGRLFGNFGEYAYRCFAYTFGSYQGSGACSDARPGLLIAFDTAADFVEIAGAWNSDFTTLYAFDDHFNLIGSGAGPRLPKQGEYNRSVASFSSSAQNIRYVVAGSVGGGIALDTLRYRAVPEPSTLALSAMGLAFAFGARARRRLRRK